MSKALKVVTMLALVALVMGSFAYVANAGATVYTATNDDNPSGNSTSIFINAVYHSQITTGGVGLGGGYFGTPRVDISVGHNGKCIFVANAASSTIAYIDYPTLGGEQASYFGGNGDEYGIGLASVGNVLVATWTESGTIEAFGIGANCTLTQGSAVTSVGLNGGALDGLSVAPNGKWVLTTYADGSFGITPLSGTTLGTTSQALSACYSSVSGLPTGTAIDPTSTYGYLDCLGGIPATIDTFTYPSTVTTTNTPASAGGTAIYGSNTLGLSTDGKQMDIVGTFSGSVQSATVSGATVTGNSCSNVSLPGYGSSWIYPGTINVLGSSTKGGAIVAEAGFGYSGNNSYVQEITSTTGSGCLSAGPQGTDANSEYVLAAASYLKP